MGEDRFGCAIFLSYISLAKMKTIFKMMQTIFLQSFRTTWVDGALLRPDKSGRSPAHCFNSHCVRIFGYQLRAALPRESIGFHLLVSAVIVVDSP